MFKYSFFIIDQISSTNYLKSIRYLKNILNYNSFNLEGLTKDYHILSFYYFNFVFHIFLVTLNKKIQGKCGHIPYKSQYKKQIKFKNNNQFLNKFEEYTMIKLNKFKFNHFEYLIKVFQNSEWLGYYFLTKYNFYNCFQNNLLATNISQLNINIQHFLYKYAIKRPISSNNIILIQFNSDRLPFEEELFGDFLYPFTLRFYNKRLLQDPYKNFSNIIIKVFS